MSNFTKVKGDYYLDGYEVLFNPIKIRSSGKQDRVDAQLWVTKSQITDLLNTENWFEIDINVATPFETLGKLVVIHNREIRPYSLAPDWQLHRSYTERDSSGKMVGFKEATFDTAKDREHMIMVAEERFEDLIRGEALVN